MRLFLGKLCHISPLFVLLCSDEEGADGLEILMDPPEGFRNSDVDRFSESQVMKEFLIFFVKQLM